MFLANPLTRPPPALRGCVRRFQRDTANAFAAFEKAPRRGVRSVRSREKAKAAVCATRPAILGHRDVPRRAQSCGMRVC